MEPIFILNPESEYNDGVMLEYRNGEYSLVKARRGAGGTAYMDWCYPQGKGRMPGAKAIPWKIPLGKRETALDILGQILKTLKGGKDEAPPSAQGDVPF